MTRSSRVGFSLLFVVVVTCIQSRPGVRQTKRDPQRERERETGGDFILESLWPDPQLAAKFRFDVFDFLIVCVMRATCEEARRKHKKLIPGDVRVGAVRPANSSPPRPSALLQAGPLLRDEAGTRGAISGPFKIWG